MDEHPVRLGRPGHGAVPVIAKHELVRQRRQDRKQPGAKARIGSPGLAGSEAA